MNHQEQINYGMIGMVSHKHKVVKEPKIKESTIHNQVCKYLRLLKVMFMSDFAAGMQLSSFKAIQQSLQKSEHSYPDIIIFEPRGLFHGLFIELKRDRDALYNKNGSRKKSVHLDSQDECHKLLRAKGYKVEFCCGFDEAKKLIDDYLNGDNYSDWRSHLDGIG